MIGWAPPGAAEAEHIFELLPQPRVTPQVIECAWAPAAEEDDDNLFWGAGWRKAISKAAAGSLSCQTGKRRKRDQSDGSRETLKGRNVAQPKRLPRFNGQRSGTDLTFFGLTCPCPTSNHALSRPDLTTGALKLSNKRQFGYYNLTNRQI